MRRNGQRVTDAVLVPIILNTYGAVGEKAAEFFYAVAGVEAKRIIDEISMLAVLLSAEMILQSHAPSNLSNLVSLPNSSAPAADPGAQPDVGEGEKGTERDEAGFLRPELRGETEGSRVECLACSSSAGKKVFTTAARWNWNRHVQLKHKPPLASGQDTEPAVEPVAEPAAEPAARSQQKRKPARRSIRGQGESASAKVKAPAHVQPAAQLHHVPPKPVDSDAKICNFRTCPAAHCGDERNVFGEERLICETVPSINPDRNRSQAEARNSQVKHLDSSVPKTGSDGAASSASRFSKTNNAFQMFSSTEN